MSTIDSTARSISAIVLFAVTYKTTQNWVAASIMAALTLAVFIIADIGEAKEAQRKPQSCFDKIED